MIITINLLAKNGVIKDNVFNLNNVKYDLNNEDFKI